MHILLMKTWSYYLISCKIQYVDSDITKRQTSEFCCYCPNILTLSARTDTVEHSPGTKLKDVHLRWLGSLTLQKSVLRNGQHRFQNYVYIVFCVRSLKFNSALLLQFYLRKSSGFSNVIFIRFKFSFKILFLKDY